MLSSSRTTPTSPLVNNKQSGVGSRDQVAYSALGGTSNGGTMFVTPLPKVVYPMDEAPLVRQEIIDITVNIQCFMAAISKLKKAMEESSDVQRSKKEWSFCSFVCLSCGSVYVCTHVVGLCS